MLKNSHLATLQFEVEIGCNFFDGHRKCRRVYKVVTANAVFTGPTPHFLPSPGTDGIASGAASQTASSDGTERYEPAGDGARLDRPRADRQESPRAGRRRSGLVLLRGIAGFFTEGPLISL